MAKKRGAGAPIGTGRVTPKGTRADAPPPGLSSRYTPPTPRQYRTSPLWVPILMFGLLGLGGALIFANYLGILPFTNGTASTGVLALGLVCITGGFVIATQYR